VLVCSSTKTNSKMLAYSAVVWPVVRSATKSDEY